MPTPPPVPPAERSPYGPDGVPKTVEDVSHRVRHAAERHARDASAAAGEHRVGAAVSWLEDPWVRLAGAAVAGYVLGALVHARGDRDEPPAPPRPRPRTMPEPVAAYRSSVAAEDRPSGIRFR